MTTDTEEYEGHSEWRWQEVRGRMSDWAAGESRILKNEADVHDYMFTATEHEFMKMIYQTLDDLHRLIEKNNAVQSAKRKQTPAKPQ